MLLDRWTPDMYQIDQKCLPPSCYGGNYPQPPRLWVLHCTDTVGPNSGTYTVEQLYNLFAGENGAASSNYGIDAQHIVQMVKDGSEAFHVCSIGNRICAGVELCITSDKAQALEVFRKAIWLTVKMVLEHDMLPLRHADVSQIWPAAMYKNQQGQEIGTDHTDPDQFLAYHGYSWDDFLANVDYLVKQARTMPASSTPSPISVQVGDVLIPGAVVWGGQTCVPIRPYTDALWKHWQQEKQEPQVNYDPATFSVTVK